MGRKKLIPTPQLNFSRVSADTWLLWVSWVRGGNSVKKGGQTESSAGKQRKKSGGHGVTDAMCNKVTESELQDVGSDICRYCGVVGVLIHNRTY
ncbi:uncharacterized protein RAG0_09540 [Rhynchosporium agropyri]|uniref:Uncharacterized protein n=1 Tax=Rhynchosporium agropyri TaxID=914238 RepID=A0A1E1KVW3_9HELO|nr:uncharacterized protein RAG0_09540 [Rhynchosporium agropyri]